MELPSFLRFLRQRNTLLIVAFLLGWVIALDLLWLIPTRQSLENSASELSLQVAESANSNVRAALERDLENVQFAAQDIREMPQMRDESLMRLTTRTGTVMRAVIVDENGAVLYSAGELPAGVTEPDYSKIPGIYAAFSGASNFGAVSTLPDGTSYAFLSVPIETSGSEKAVLVAAVSFANLAKTIEATPSPSWHIYITDKSGMEIIGPEAGTSGNLLQRPIVQKVVVDGLVANGLSGNDGYVNEHGIPVFVVGEPIPIANWSIFVERPLYEAFSAVTVVDWLAVAILVLGAIAIVISMASYWRLALLTERLEAQRAELQEKNHRLEELDKMKSEFLSIAAHQLRTPLSAMKWTLEAALGGTIDNELRSLLLKGNDTNERMIRLVDDMLAVTRIEAGKQRYALVPLHIEDVIDNIMLDFISQARAHDLMLTFERPAEQLPYIDADPERMHDILGNLIENAIRYTPQNGTITIRAAHEGDTVKVSVTDSGIGIPPEQQTNIFNKFFRADNAAKVQTDGSGLGLFIVKATVERHGGHVWFESTLGKGTTFFFTIPVHKEGGQTP